MGLYIYYLFLGDLKIFQARFKKRASQKKLLQMSIVYLMYFILMYVMYKISLCVYYNSFLVGVLTF